MSLARSLVASAVTAFAFFAATRDASAAGLKGYASYGQDYSKSISKDDFGAGFQLYGRATAVDYAQTCASSKPETFCADALPQIKPMCMTIQKIISPIICQKSSGQALKAEGKAGADVTLFGKDLDLFELSAMADAEPTTTTAGYGIYVLGMKVKGESTNGTFEKDASLGSRTIAEVSSTFMLGPVPLTVEAAATGNLGIKFALSAATSQVSAQARPYVSVDGVFSAGVGVKGFSGGVEGDLLLVEISTPATATLTWNGGKSFSYNASLDLDIQALDGSVSLYGELGPWRKTWEIYSWTGLDYTKNLGSKQGSFSL